MTIARDLEEQSILGTFRVPEPESYPEQPTPPNPDLLAVLDQIRVLSEDVRNQPAPVFNIPPPAEPDWGQLADSVTQPIVDMGNRIVEAVPKSYPPPQVTVQRDESLGELLQKIQTTLDNLAFSMKGLGRLGSGGGTVSMAPNQQVNAVITGYAVDATSADQETNPISDTNSHVVYTPASGKNVQLRWLYAKNLRSGNTTVLTVTLDSQLIYEIPLDPGDVFAHKVVRQGTSNGDLHVQCSVASTVYVNCDAKDV